MKVVVYGSRPDGHAKVVTELAANVPALELVGLIDDFPENAGRTLRDLRVLGTGKDLAALRERWKVEGMLFGFGESSGRVEIARRAIDVGYALPRLVDGSARVCESATLGDGAQVLARAYIGPDAALGTGTLVNTAAVIEHDVALSDGAVVGPAATLCGRVRVGREATIGAGATILPDVRVGAAAVVGAGALVREDVAEATVVAGVPARSLESAQTGLA